MALGLEFPDGELSDTLFLGGVTDRSVRAWLRAPDTTSVTVTLEVAGSSHSVEARPDAGHDHVAAIDLTLDAAHPGEEFVVTAGSHRRIGRFAPSAASPAPFTFAFGSCHQPFQPNDDNRLAKHAGAAIYPPLLTLMREHDARFLLLNGDQVYSDGVDGQSVRKWARNRSADDKPSFEEYLEAYRHLYRGYFNESGFRALLEAFPTRMMWDDHDIADSWGSRFIEVEEDRQMYRAASQTFREYQRARALGAPFGGEAPYHHEFRYGDTAFWVMDLRGIRSWQDEVVLGEAQLADTAAFLDRARADEIRTVFVVASIPVIHFSPAIVSVLQWVPGNKGSDVRDRWDAAPFREERDRLIELLTAWQRLDPRHQVVVLSGDVHAGAAFIVRDRRTGGRFHQWTSSSLSAPGGLAHNVANRVGSRLVNWGERVCEAARVGVDPRNNAGLVRVRPIEGGGHHVTFDLYAHDAHGSLVRSIHASAIPPGPA